MKFDFLQTIEKIRNTASKRRAVQEYEKILKPISEDVTSLDFYQNYVSKLKTITFEFPDSVTLDAFSAELFLQLAAASFSSKCELKLSEDLKMFLYISTSSDRSSTKRSFVKLSEEKIQALFEIYIHEQLELELIAHTDFEEKLKILEKQDIIIENWNNYILRMQANKMVEAFCADNM